MRVLALIALLAAVGCGTGAGAPAASSGATELKIAYWSQGRGAGPAKTWTLRCGPAAAGTLPRAASACRKLAAMRNPFAPIPQDTLCTEQYGGPQVAVITGTFRGHALWTQLASRDGCEIARSKRLSFLVPGYGAGAEA